MVCFSDKFIVVMPDDILGWKGSNMDKNAIWRTYN